jgi:hypothetical protein
VSDQDWAAAHARLASARAIYFHATDRREGRPALGSPSKYLLTNLALCGSCGGPLKVLSRSHGLGRKYFYGCAWHHDRGRKACTNNDDAPMVDTNDALIEGLLDDLLDPTMLQDAADEALRLLQGDAQADRLDRLNTEILSVSRERDRLVAAIAAGGELEGLLEALKARDSKQRALEADRDALRVQRRLKASDAIRVREELLEISEGWRRVLSDDPPNARPIVTTLLNGRRVTIAPKGSKRWELRGEATLTGLFSKVFALGMASPSGTDNHYQRVFRGEWVREQFAA